MITRDDVEGLFASPLGRIQDGDLRKKVIDTWVTACKRGEWESVDALRKMPFTLLTDCHGVSFIEHTIAVTEGAVALAGAQIDAYDEMPYAIDMDRLLAGGLLHDVGKLVEITPDGKGGFKKSRADLCARHPISGAILAAEMGLSDEIVNTIACHAREGDGRPQVIETVLIHQADFATFNPLTMLRDGKLIT